MIEGFKLDFTGEELKDHVAKKVQYHLERAAFYDQQAKQLAAGGAQPAQFTGGDPIRALQEQGKTHARRSEFFDVLTKHIVRGETYRLSEDDLIKLEIISRGW